MIDWSKPIRTILNQQPARLICSDRKPTRYNSATHVVLFENKINNGESVSLCDVHGNSLETRTKFIENVPPERRSRYHFLYKKPNISDLSYPTLYEIIMCSTHLSDYERGLMFGFIEFVYEDDKVVDVLLHPRF